MGLPTTALELAAETLGMRIYQKAGERLGAVRVVDRGGAIRVQRSHALVQACTPGTAARVLDEVWGAMSRSEDGRITVPGLFLLHGHHVADLSGVESLEQAKALAASELDGQERDAPTVLVGIPVSRVTGSDSPV
jgi:hypothetical protein